VFQRLLQRFVPPPSSTSVLQPETTPI
jgi:hypothetical protein